MQKRIIFCALIFTALMLHTTAFSQAPNAMLSGRITIIDIREIGIGYGPSSDRINVDVIIHLDSAPQRAFGFQLRNDQQLQVRKAMLELLKDAFRNNWTVTIDINDVPGRSNAVIHAVRVQR